MTDALRVVDLVKRYGRFVAVCGVSFTVPSGGITGLLGPNGSGKSSVLHSITGVVTATSGTVTIAGRAHDTAAAKAVTGFVPDDLPLPLNLTGFEYLDLVRRLQPGTDPTLTDELVSLLGMTRALPRLVAEYSHGMKRKIQMIAALGHRPRLLILDEPFRGLDPEAHVILRELIASFVRDGGGVLVATHDLSAAEGYCDAVTVVADGCVVADGPPHRLMDEHGQRSLEGVFLAATGLAERTRSKHEQLSALRLTAGPGAADGARTAVRNGGR